MLRFFLRKTFYDGWDHLFMLAAYNGAALAVAALGIWVPTLADSVALRLVGLVFACMGLSVWSAAAGYACWELANFRPFSWDLAKKGLAWAVRPGLQLGAVVTAAVLVASVVFPFYATMGGFVGLFAMSLAFWCFLGLGLTLLYAIPARLALGCGFRASLKTAFMMVVDSPLGALGLALHGLACLALSPFVAFLLPGPAAALLGTAEATRLRLKRFDWLRAQGGRRAKTPWAELLADDEEAVGRRTLKELVFPWKQ